MPFYSIQCEVCATPGTANLSFAEYDEAREGKHTISCADCGGWAKIVFDPGAVSFVLKDGVSGGWISKAGKENAYRARRNKVMAQRERDHVFKSRLQPNYGGELTGSWEDAKDAAFTTTYEKVRQEHGSELARQAASESASTYDSLVKRS